MKHYVKIFYPAILFFAACNPNNAGNKIAEQKQPVQVTTQPAKPAKPFANVQFASKRDTTCGMPLSAGLTDTLHFKGKVYGFCSKECKDGFVNTLKQQNKL